MFNKEVVGSDAFLDMSKGARALYLELNMNADDDGLLGNIKRIIRGADATAEEYKELLDNRFLIELPSGIVAIKHWWINNKIPKDRYHATKYSEDLSLLTKKSNGSYTECIQKLVQLSTKNVPENRIDQNRLDKNSIGPASKEAGVGMRGIGQIIKNKK